MILISLVVSLTLTVLMFILFCALSCAFVEKDKRVKYLEERTRRQRESIEHLNKELCNETDETESWRNN